MRKRLQQKCRQNIRSVAISGFSTPTRQGRAELEDLLLIKAYVWLSVMFYYSFSRPTEGIVRVNGFTGHGRAGGRLQ